MAAGSGVIDIILSHLSDFSIEKRKFVEDISKNLPSSREE
jgi:hypothetical protein